MVQTLKTRSIEWPTIAVIALVYVVLGGLILFHATLPWWVILLVGPYFAALHTSLQHEVLHGHPTRNRRINEALIFLTPTMWLPFHRYKDTHLIHHNNQHLTDPEMDPESYYLLPNGWSGMPGVKRKLFQLNHTLAGRMLMGPAIGMMQFWSAELRDVVKGDVRKATTWMVFASSCALVFAFVIWCGMPVWQYLLLIAYPGISLALVRSYCEHQAAEQIGHRTIIVECSLFWSFLFLNNNLHVPHHERPSLPWYQLPDYYRSERDAMISQNNGYVMSYAEIFRRYFFFAKEPIAHPNLNWLKR
jgi:fatty acid desaturase